MNIKKYFTLMVGLMLLFSGAMIRGDDKAEAETAKKKANTSIAFGLDLSQGNTEALGLNVDFNIDWMFLEKTELQCSASVSYLEVDGEKKADRMFLQILMDHLLAKRITFFLLAKPYRNLLQDVEFRLETGGGFKYDFIDNFADGKDILHTDLSLSAAIIYEQTEYTNQVVQKIIRLSIRPKIKQELSKNLQVQIMLFYQPSFEDFRNYRLLLDSGVQFSISKAVSYVLKFLGEYNSLVPENVKKQDYRLINQLSLSF
jgi:putative salt-induced outer membrane protein YdiY